MDANPERVKFLSQSDFIADGGNVKLLLKGWSLRAIGNYSQNEDLFEYIV